MKRGWPGVTSLGHSPARFPMEKNRLSLSIHQERLLLIEFSALLKSTCSVPANIEKAQRWAPQMLSWGCAARRRSLSHFPRRKSSPTNSGRSVALKGYFCFDHQSKIWIIETEKVSARKIKGGGGCPFGKGPATAAFVLICSVDWRVSKAFSRLLPAAQCHWNIVAHLRELVFAQATIYSN